jgi:hypothetical protein
MKGITEKLTCDPGAPCCTLFFFFHLFFDAPVPGAGQPSVATEEAVAAYAGTESTAVEHLLESDSTAAAAFAGTEVACKQEVPAGGKEVVDL